MLLWYYIEDLGKNRKGREKHMKKCLENGYVYKVNSSIDTMFLTLFVPGITDR